MPRLTSLPASLAPLVVALAGLFVHGLGMAAAGNEPAATDTVEEVKPPKDSRAAREARPC